MGRRKSGRFPLRKFLSHYLKQSRLTILNLFTISKFYNTVFTNVFMENKVGFGDLFSSAVNNFKKGFKDCFSVGLKYYIIPTFILSLIMTFVFGVYRIGFEKTLGFGALLFLLFFIIVSVFLYIFVEVYLVLYFAGKKKNILSVSKGKVWSSFLFYLVFAIFVSLLFLLLIIPGVVFLVFWVFGFYIFVLEDKGIVESLGASFDLVRDNWWRTLWYGIIIVFFMGIINWIASSIFSSSLESGIFVSLGTIVSMIVSMIINIFVTSFFVEYYKTRKKGK